ncbi:MAG: hypothetical protein R8K53_00250 [Mariprofundaceae bacterium]
MKLSFSMDALDAAGSKAWRLQDDMQHWRSCLYGEPMQDRDARFGEPAAAEEWHGLRMKRDKNVGLVVRKKPGAFDFLMRGIFTHAVLHRFSAAPIPDKQQMLDTIRALAAGTPWLPHLNIAGHFRALDTTQERIIGNLHIAVRGEIASSEAYIGVQAAENSTLMDITYRQFLAGWLQHLNSGNMAVFVPDIEKLKAETADNEAIRHWQYESTVN